MGKAPRRLANGRFAKKKSGGLYSVYTRPALTTKNGRKRRQYSVVYQKRSRSKKISDPYSESVFVRKRYRESTRSQMPDLVKRFTSFKDRPQSVINRFMEEFYPAAFALAKRSYKKPQGSTTAQAAAKVRNIAMRSVMSAYQTTKKGVEDGWSEADFKRNGVVPLAVDIVKKGTSSSRSKRSYARSRALRSTSAPKIVKKNIVFSSGTAKKKSKKKRHYVTQGPLHRAKLHRTLLLNKPKRKLTKLEEVLEIKLAKTPISQRSPVKTRSPSKRRRPDYFTYDTWNYEDKSKSIDTGTGKKRPFRKGGGSFPTWKFVAGKSGLKSKIGTGLLRGGRVALRSNLLRFEPDFKFRASDQPRTMKQTSGKKAVMNMNQFTNFYPKRYIAGKPSRFRSRTKSFVQGSVVAAEKFRPKGPLINLRDPNKYPLDKSFKSDLQLRKELEQQTKLFEARYAAKARHRGPPAAPPNITVPVTFPTSLSSAQLTGYQAPSIHRMPQKPWGFQSKVEPEPMSFSTEPLLKEGEKEEQPYQLFEPEKLQRVGEERFDPAEGEEEEFNISALSPIKRLSLSPSKPFVRPTFGQPLISPATVEKHRSTLTEDRREELRREIREMVAQWRAAEDKKNELRHELQQLDESMDISFEEDPLADVRIAQRRKDDLIFDLQEAIEEADRSRSLANQLQAQLDAEESRGNGRGYQERLRDRVRRARAIKYGKGRRGGAFKGFSETLYRAVPAIRGFVGDEIYEVEREVLM